MSQIWPPCNINPSVKQYMHLRAGIHIPSNSRYRPCSNHDAALVWWIRLPFVYVRCTQQLLVLRLSREAGFPCCTSFVVVGPHGGVPSCGADRRTRRQATRETSQTQQDCRTDALRRAPPRPQRSHCRAARRHTTRYHTQHATSAAGVCHPQISITHNKNAWNTHVCSQSSDKCVLELGFWTECLITYTTMCVPKLVARLCSRLLAYDQMCVCHVILFVKSCRVHMTYATQGCPMLSRHTHTHTTHKPAN